MSDLRKEFQETLPDLREEDIAGSGFAITGYTVHAGLGGDAALARLRGRLRKRGLRLMLDFVPNHMAPDHPWVEQHPDYFVHGSDADLANSPQNYCRVKTSRGSPVLAYGRQASAIDRPEASRGAGGQWDQRPIPGRERRGQTQCTRRRVESMRLDLDQCAPRLYEAASRQANKKGVGVELEYVCLSIE